MDSGPDGTLTISGEGAMADYALMNDYYEMGGRWYFGTTAPWWTDPWNIHAVVLEDGLTSIGNYAFTGCMQLESLQIPASVASIGKDPFLSCCAITAYIVDPDNARFSSDTDGVLYDKAQTRLIRYPVGNPRTTFTIPDTVTVIGSSAFSTAVGGVAPAYTDYHGKLSGLVIPVGVTKIEDGALTHSDELQYIKILNPDCEMSYYAFMLSCDGERTPYGLKVYGYLGSTAETSAQEAEENTAAIPGYGPVENLFQALCPTDYTHTVTEATETAPTCTEAGHLAGWYCTDCGAWLIGDTVDPINHRNAYDVAAAEATATEHGFTAGRYCPDCNTWVSGHAVIHNRLGAQTVLQAPTATEDGLVDIVCTVCGEHGQYTVSATGPQPGDNGDNDSGGFWAQITNFFRGIVDWFLRLFRWFGK